MFKKIDGIINLEFVCSLVKTWRFWLQILKRQIIFVIYMESLSMLLQINGVTVFSLTFWLKHLLFWRFLTLILEFWNSFMQVFSGIAICTTNLIDLHKGFLLVYL